MRAQHCSPDLPVIEPLGPQILSTFSFSPERSTMHFDAAVLVFLALGLSVGSLLVFFFATRLVVANWENGDGRIFCWLVD